MVKFVIKILLDFGKAEFDRSRNYLCFKSRKTRQKTIKHLRETLELLESKKDIFLVEDEGTVITCGHQYKKRKPDNKKRRQG